MNKKSKKNAESIWIYGKHAARAALLNKRRIILKFILLESNTKFLQEISFFLSQRKIEPEFVNKNYFDMLFGKEAVHQGCAVLTKRLREPSLKELIKDESDNSPFVFLDQVVDPQNIGGILRASAVFGARAVVITESHSPKTTPTIAKAASGGLEIVPLVRVNNLAQSIDFLKRHGFWLVGLDEHSEKSLYEVELPEKLMFIIGNEGSGLRRLSKDVCDFIVRFPGTNTFTTLNATQAATIALYENAKRKMNGGEFR